MLFWFSTAKNIVNIWVPFLSITQKFLGCFGWTVYFKNHLYIFSKEGSAPWKMSFNFRLYVVYLESRWAFPMQKYRWNSFPFSDKTSKRIQIIHHIVARVTNWKLIRRISNWLTDNSKMLKLKLFPKLCGYGNRQCF